MLNKICQLSYDAGDIIMRIYKDNQFFSISQKVDHSPVTLADIEAHKVITKGLKKISPEIPILSEEDPPFWEQRRYWKTYWLVDPLDGTKEFIKRNGEFTVNIALIEEGKPVLGVIHAPALGVTYMGNVDKAWKQQDGHKTQIQVREARPPLVVISRSHADVDTELKDYLKRLGTHQTIALGSSLKFCFVAEGKAQLYPRFGSTNIWDTGAGHAIAVAAGAHVYDWQGKTLDYTPKKSFLNLGFRVSLF
ncbi:3'(2'),5'-bisphosphate nucleotidase CysQ [Candidatus Pantoea carbekii]|uniref:3'(2'),5'-bisphosphate nucleotidase CysQ n=1 Tax=Candidatus Pantoea carbekii TaxID=1235990 RepID=U3U954_9GAMM|nr:3'(2'),5'-bisphosphate nucleotidase CysQ [Candidatus Pantoea carbekii]AKC32531.1 cysQ protein [Candidatus Pantoea carbekii]BAO00258.1 CysQ protein [Candidatus Pantoea carbekii]